MNKFFICIAAVCVSACGNDMQSSNRVANIFTPTELVASDADSFLSPLGSCDAAEKSIDRRLAPGQTFTRVLSTRDYTEKSRLWTQRSHLKIESVDVASGVTTFVDTISTSDGFSGWAKGQTTATFTNNSTSVITDYVELSPSLEKAMAEDDKTPESSLEVNWSCYVDGSLADVSKVQKGTYTLASGKKVNAVRAEKVISGAIICTKYSKTSPTDPNPPMPVEEKQLGQGTFTEVYMTSPDVPNKDGCRGGAELERLREIKDSNNRVVDSSGERLENAVY